MSTTYATKHSFDVVFDSLKVFRLILEALSHPTRVVSLKGCAEKLSGINPFFLTVALTLLDNELCFNTCEDRLLSDEIAALTHARRALVEEADLIFVCSPKDLKNVIENAKGGTLIDPHKSATIVVRNVVNELVPHCWLNFTGPGINDSITTLVSETVRDALALRDAQYYEYPRGIDFLFISDEGDLFAVPRLVHIEQATSASRQSPARRKTRKSYPSDQLQTDYLQKENGIRTLFAPERVFEGTD